MKNYDIPTNSMIGNPTPAKPKLLLYIEIGLAVLGVLLVIGFAWWFFFVRTSVVVDTTPDTFEEKQRVLESLPDNPDNKALSPETKAEILKNTSSKIEQNQ